MNNLIAEFKPGQVWSYHTRKGEESSSLTILKVEKHSKIGEIIHIATDSLNIIGPESGQQFGSSISHMPFSKDALVKSVKALQEEASSLPDFSEGYNDWKMQFESGNAGVFSIPVAKAIEFIETTIDQ